MHAQDPQGARTGQVCGGITLEDRGEEHLRGAVALPPGTPGGRRQACWKEILSEIVWGSSLSHREWSRIADIRLQR